MSRSRLLVVLLGLGILSLSAVWPASAEIISTGRPSALTADSENYPNVGIETRDTSRLEISDVAAFLDSMYAAIDSNTETGEGSMEIGGIWCFIPDRSVGFTVDGTLTIVGSGSTLTIDKDLHPGDAATGTTMIDLGDFNIWNANRFTTRTDLTGGDVNGDGTTDLSDFNIWNDSQPVPEPAVLMLLLGGALALVPVWRRRR